MPVATRFSAVIIIGLVRSLGSQYVGEQWTSALVFAILWIPFVLMVWRFWFVTDDAYISFRYSRNLALGHGLRFNPGEVPPAESARVMPASDSAPRAQA